jgi:DNA-binding GntR family transcriptional regulator
LRVAGQSQKIVRKKLHEQVYEYLKQDILEQRIGFSEKLTNRDLRERYGVSSTPARDAINRLYLEGLLDEISQGGARIISFDRGRALETNEMMFVLHKEALALMIERADPGEALPRMEAVLKLQEENLGGGLYDQYDYQFHRLFFDFCGNSRIAQLYIQHSGLWTLLLKAFHTGVDSRGAALAQHVRLKDAYKSRDGVLAQSVLKAHFDDAARALRNMLQYS